MRKLKLAMLFALAFSPCLLHGLEDILSQIKRGEKYPVPAEAQQYGERQERYHPIDPRTGRAMLDTRGNRVIRTRTVREWITKDQVNQIRGLISAHEDRFRALVIDRKTISRDEYFRLIDNATAAVKMARTIGGPTTGRIIEFVDQVKRYLTRIGMLKHSVYKYAIKRLLIEAKRRFTRRALRSDPDFKPALLKLYREFGITR
jgi:hypothetical protein